MADLSTLSKDELIALLNQKNQTIETTEEEPCQYVPLRSNQKPCVNMAVTEWGFCKRHRSTIQSKNAKEKWDEEHTPEIEPVQTEIEEQKADPEPSQKEIEKVEEEASKNAEKKEIRKQVEKTSKKPKIKKKVIKPNYWGRFEDKTTHLLFDPVSRHVYGVQGKGRDVLPLTSNHKAICEARGWKYLDGKSTTQEEEEETMTSSEYETDSEFEDSETEETETETEESESDIEEYSESDYTSDSDDEYY